MASYCRKMELKFNLTQVLSPRKFLPKDQQQIPRQDERKQKLKNGIQKTLQQVGNYQQFEQAMKALGYQILKARGISFIDDKKVKTKGSEVGFSLMKIEKILALKQNQENIHKHENFQQAESQKQERNAGKVSSLLPQKIVLKKQSQSPVIARQKKVTELIYQIIEPEKISDQLGPELLKKRRKKKKQRPHH